MPMARLSSWGLMRSGIVWQGRSPVSSDKECARAPFGLPDSLTQQAAGSRPQADPLKPRAAPEHGCALCALPRAHMQVPD